MAPGQSFPPTSCLLHEGQTIAPNPLSESELIELMDSHGIGTDATIPDHISKIVEREYVSRLADQRLVPTTLGMALMDVRVRNFFRHICVFELATSFRHVTRAFSLRVCVCVCVCVRARSCVQGYNDLGLAPLSKPHMRATVEADLSAICAGTKIRTVVVKECLDAMRPVFIRAAQHMSVIVSRVGQHLRPVAQSSVPMPGRGLVGRCGDCGGQLAPYMCQGPSGEKGVSRSLRCNACAKSYALPDFAVDVRSTDSACPLCGFGVVQVS
jgi:DNA topoisomerase III